MRDFVAYNTVDGSIRWIGVTDIEPPAEPGVGFLMDAVASLMDRVDLATMTIESQPGLGAGISSLVLAAGESITITPPVTVSVYIDGARLGDIDPGGDTIQFDTPGLYELRLDPLTHTHLIQVESVTVT